MDTFKRAVRKIQEGEGNIKLALDVFLLTYRTTPNPNVPDGKSPAEAMYGRPLRTSLDLLRAPQERIPDTVSEAESNRPRTFAPKEAVYAKVYANNKWTWAPGTVVEKVGKVMYNIWLNSKRMIRSHINQLRARTPSGPDIEQTPTPPKQLPINILLNEWKLPCISSPVLAPTSQPPDLVSPDPESPGSPVGQPVASPASSSQSKTTSSTTESSTNSSPVVKLPRRSSRNRRPPQWFQAYRRY